MVTEMAVRLIFSSVLFVSLFASADEVVAPAAPFEVGRIPYSNEWEFEKPRSAIFFGLSQKNFATQQILISDYTADLGTGSMSVPSIEYFTEIVQLSSTKFSFYGHYGLGINSLATQLSNPDIKMSDVSRKGTLTFYDVEAGLNLLYEIRSSIRAYAGAQLLMTGYRHSASISGAERQQNAWYWEPVVGLLCPGLLFEKGSIFAQMSLPRVINDSDALLSTNPSMTAGIGLSY